MAKKKPKSGAPKGNQNAVKPDDEKRSKRVVAFVTEEDAEQARLAVEAGDYKTVSDLLWKGLRAELRRNARKKK